MLPTSSRTTKYVQFKVLINVDSIEEFKPPKIEKISIIEPTYSVCLIFYFFSQKNRLHGRMEEIDWEILDFVFQKKQRLISLQLEEK